MAKKADDTARVLRVMSSKHHELEATISHLKSSKTSSEEELRSQAAQVAAQPTGLTLWTLSAEACSMRATGSGALHAHMQARLQGAECVLGY
jgi:hypothetical protein